MVVVNARLSNKRNNIINGDGIFAVVQGVYLVEVYRLIYGF